MPQLLSQVAVGTIVKIKENGTPVDYIVINQGNPDNAVQYSNVNGTWVLRKDIYNNYPWATSGSPWYINSAIAPYVQSTFNNIIDSLLLLSVHTVRIPYAGTMTGEGGYECKFFLLSGTELGYNDVSVYPEGGKLQYFDNNMGISSKFIANYSGSPSSWWTRSNYRDPDGSLGPYVTYAGAEGAIGNGRNSDSRGVRPCFVIDNIVQVDDDNNVTPPQPPTAPASINVPAVAKGQPCAITWTAATDPDGTIASYTLERSINNSGWSQIFSGNALTYTDTIGDSWATVAYRVCAVNNMGMAGPYATSETQTVQSGLIYVEGPLNNMGTQNAPFAFTFTINITGASSAITDIATTVTLDGAQLYSENVSTGQQISINIDTRAIGFETHTVNVSAIKSGYVSADEDYTFVVTPFEFPAGGIATQIQDDSGNVLFPQTVANAVKGVLGGSVGDNLNNLVKSVLYEGGTFTDYFGNAISMGAKIATGSYVGTGTYGQANPCSLTFEFSPRVLIIVTQDLPPEVSGYTTGKNIGFFFNVFPVSIAFGTIYGDVTDDIRTTLYFSCHVNFSSNTIQYYSLYKASGGADSLQFNQNNITYYYTAIE